MYFFLNIKRTCLTTVCLICERSSKNTLTV